jgi:hypothetical protein
MCLSNNGTTLRNTFASFLVFTSVAQLWGNNQQEGREKLYRTITDLRAHTSVMIVAAAPGHEDFATIAYLRYKLGAKIVTVYVSNGESEESDSIGLLPNEQAATLRREAFEAMQSIDAQAYFLNLPDVASASSERSLRQQWSIDTLKQRFLQALALYRPDAIVICDGESGSGASLTQSFIEREVLRIVRSTMMGMPRLVSRTIAPAFRWKVRRIFAARRSVRARTFALSATDMATGKHFSDLGVDISKAYRSLKTTLPVRLSLAKKSYYVAFPEQASSLKSLEGELAAVLSNGVRPLEVRINDFCDLVEGLIASPLRHPFDTLRTLGISHSLLQRVDTAITKIYSFPFLDQVVLLRWKSDLEALRVLLLDVRVHFELTERVLAERQLTFLTIDSILGVEQNKNAQVHFTSVNQGWIINEQVGRKYGLTYGEHYRILSPQKISYHIPQSQYGLQNSQFAEQLSFVVIRQERDSLKDFQIRVSIPIFFAPRFSVELFTPLVRVLPSERVILKLTNNSRDGLRDKVLIADTLVNAKGHEFRLSTKGSSFQDTLELHWTDSIKEGSYLIPIRIGQHEIGNFVARKLSIKVDSGATVGLLGGTAQSRTAEALRQLAIPFTNLALSDVEKSVVSTMRSIIIDRRSMTLLDGFSRHAASLKGFAERGGTLIVLAQEMRAWNRTPLIDGLRLEQSSIFDFQTKVQIDTSSSLFSHPNVISSDDWNDWVFRRSYNKAFLKGNKRTMHSILFSAKGRWPFVVSSSLGKGKIIYVDFDLQHQWVNLHAGAFKLLANLLAY